MGNTSSPEIVGFLNLEVDRKDSKVWKDIGFLFLKGIQFGFKSFWIIFKLKWVMEGKHLSVLIEGG